MRGGKQFGDIKRRSYRSCNCSSVDEKNVKDTSDFDLDYLRTENIFDIIRRKERLSVMDWDYIIDCSQFKDTRPRITTYQTKAHEELLPESGSDSSGESSSSLEDEDLPIESSIPKPVGPTVQAKTLPKKKVIVLEEEFLSDSSSSSDASSKPSILEQFITENDNNKNMPDTHSPVLEKRDIRNVSLLAIGNATTSNYLTKPTSTAQDLDSIWVSKILSCHNEEGIEPTPKLEIPIVDEPEVVKDSQQYKLVGLDSLPTQMPMSGDNIVGKSPLHGNITSQSLFSKNMPTAAQRMQSSEGTWHSQASYTINKLQTPKESSCMPKTQSRKHKVSFEEAYISNPQGQEPEGTLDPATRELLDQQESC